MKRCFFWIITIITLLFCFSCGKKDIKKYTQEEITEAVKKILSLPEMTEQNWVELEALVKESKNKSYYFTYSEKCINDAIKNKHWRLLILFRKYGYPINANSKWDVIEKKELNYKPDDILKFYSIAGFEIDNYVVRTALKTNYDLAVVLMKNMPKNKRDFINWKDALNDPKMLRAAMDAGFVDFDRALLECEKSSSPDIEVFNKLLRWKRQTSKVWTLY